MKKYKIGLVGATGLVGLTILELLEERNFPLEKLYLFSSARSAGQELGFRGEKLKVEELTRSSFDRELDLVFFAAGGAISKEYIPLALEKGLIAIDNSSVYRMDEDVALVVPEINPQDARGSKLIANPNCSTTQSVLAIKPILDKYGVKRIVYSSYQAVSGSGLGGLRDLEEGGADFYPYQIKDNVLPHIDDFLPSGYTKEEDKMIQETRKIFGKPDLRVTATTARVPVSHGHSVSINLELERDFNLEELRKELEAFPSLVLLDKPQENIYPQALDSVGRDEVFVGRLRRDDSLEFGLNLWVVADNLRKGAATNAVQIAELVLA